MRRHRRARKGLIRLATGSGRARWTCAVAKRDGAPPHARRLRPGRERTGGGGLVPSPAALTRGRLGGLGRVGSSPAIPAQGVATAPVGRSAGVLRDQAWDQAARRRTCPESAPVRRFAAWFLDAKTPAMWPAGEICSRTAAGGLEGLFAFAPRFPGPCRGSFGRRPRDASGASSVAPPESGSSPRAPNRFVPAVVSPPRGEVVGVAFRSSLPRRHAPAGFLGAATRMRETG